MEKHIPETESQDKKSKDFYLTKLLEGVEMLKAIQQVNINQNLMIDEYIAKLIQEIQEQSKKAQGEDSQNQSGQQSSPQQSNPKSKNSDEKSNGEKQEKKESKNGQQEQAEQSGQVGQESTTSSAEQVVKILLSMQGKEASPDSPELYQNSGNQPAEVAPKGKVWCAICKEEHEEGH